MVSYASSPPAEVIFAEEPLDEAPTGVVEGSCYRQIEFAGILAGTVTAFAGPIAFVGLAVPHLTRQIFDTTDHKVLVPAVLLYGAVLMLLCDTLAQLPASAYVLPINAITSIIGAPVVIWLLLRRRKMVF